MKRKVFIRTMGCQMNLYDSDKMLAVLEQEGFERCENESEADMILFNTCSVREGAANKVRSALGSVARLKRKNPRLLIAVAGCVPATEGERLKERNPHLDIIVTPDTIMQIGQLVAAAENGGRKRGVIEPLALTDGEGYLFPPPKVLPNRVSPVSYVTVTKGCDNFCSYCIVPYARGREKSRDPEEIIAEVKTLVGSGAKEIILIGQNVNSYRFPEKCPGGFPELLHRVSEVEGVKRLRFVTSHPKDFTFEIARAFKEIENLCPYLHIPPQSGSDRILKLMRRKYTSAEYLDKISMAREQRPDIALSGDIIVGFPGETEEDFERTKELLRIVKFDMVYAFKYSPRPETEAARLKDDISLEIKQNRLAEILALCNDIQISKAERLYSGKTVDVLTEGISPLDVGRWQGRTAHNKAMNFENTVGAQAGDITLVEVTSVEAHSLLGRTVKILN